MVNFMILFHAEGVLLIFGNERNQLTTKFMEMLAQLHSQKDDFNLLTGSRTKVKILKQNTCANALNKHVRYEYKICRMKLNSRSLFCILFISNYMLVTNSFEI